MDTPLHFAVMGYDGGNIEVAELLLENGANVNSRDAEGRTALSYAASGSEKELALLQLLLRCGADVNARDQKGKTAVMWAVSNKSLVLVEELLKYGAEVNEDSFGHWPSQPQRDDHDDDEEDFHNMFHYVVDCKTTVVLKQHWMRLKLAQLPCSGTFDAFMSDERYQKCYWKCLKEVEILKTTFIDGRTSLCEFLHKSIKNRCGYINNEKLQNLVDSPALEKQFPRYATLILAGYRETVARKSLVKPAKEAWLVLTEIHLPDICVERILDYLNNTDMINMVDGDQSSAKAAA